MNLKISNKKPAKILHLINWYFGNYCAKCGKIDLESEDFGKKCYNKLLIIRANLDVEEMTHKEFLGIVRHSFFCHPFARQFEDCPICRKFGINNRYWIKNWKGWNLTTES